MTTDPANAAFPDQRPDASFIEDPLLAVAVAEAEEFVGAGGWDQPPHLFALVVTSDLLAAEPQVAGELDPTSFFTPIAQEDVPADDLENFLARLGWPDAVVGCVLVHEILVLPPGSGDLPAEREQATALAAQHPDRVEARLAVGVLRGGPAACLLRLRGDHEDTPVRGADLAPNMVRALAATFDPDDAGGV